MLTLCLSLLLMITNSQITDKKTAEHKKKFELKNFISFELPASKRVKRRYIHYVRKRRFRTSYQQTNN